MLRLLPNECCHALHTELSSSLALDHAVAVRELGSEDGAVAISIEDTEGVVQVLLNRVRVTHESRQWR